LKVWAHTFQEKAKHQKTQKPSSETPAQTGKYTILQEKNTAEASLSIIPPFL
jgi:hypothetical protein